LTPVARQNRLTPLGELIAADARGLVYGNRGCLHDDHGRIRRGYAVKRWIACRLEFKGRRRSPLMMPGRFTELFFLDEVTALAAGHRPCAECRREDYLRLRELWSRIHPQQIGADAIDQQLHVERLTPADGRPGSVAGARRLHRLLWRELPDGAFILRGRSPALVLGDQLLDWSPNGYADPVQRPVRGDADVITPPSLLALLASGWEPVVPLVHQSAES
jgi:hypothetical protein